MINNQTVLNTSLFTELSSGAIDNHMSTQASENTAPLPLDAEKVLKVPIGDRQTISIFNEKYQWNDIKLWTNFFLLNLHKLGIGKTVTVNFKTTRDWSFSVHTNGTRAFQYDIFKLDTAENWQDLSTVQNLANYFTGDEELEFNFTIHKPFSHAYWVGVNVGDKNNLATITYDANGGRGSLVEQAMKGSTYKIRYDISIIRGWWKLVSWNTEPDGLGATYAPGDVININNNLTLYAIWKER